MKKKLLMLVLLLSSSGFGLTIRPDSIVLSIYPFTKMHSAIDTVCLKNGTNTAMTIDSIMIRFCNGDSGDFRKGYDCQPGQLLDYNYRGWTYGTTHTTLRYLRDSLFMLQDSLGKPTTISIHPNDSAFFYLQVITNCPMCDRMPSYPKTSKYLYSFHLLENTNVNLNVIINDAGSTSNLAPTDYVLKENYSIPFNSSAATTEVLMQSDGYISLKAFDVLGHEVGTIVQGMLKHGTHRFHCDAKRLAKGVYYYKFTAGSYAKTHRLILIK